MGVGVTPCMSETRVLSVQLASESVKKRMKTIILIVIIINHINVSLIVLILITYE